MVELPTDLIAPASSTLPPDLIAAPLPDDLVPAEGSWTDVAKRALENAPSSAFKAVEGLSKLGTSTGLAETLKPVVEHPVQSIEGIISHYKGYLSEEGLKKALATDPVGTAMDILGLAGGVAGLAGKATTLGKAANVAKAGETVTATEGVEAVRPAEAASAAAKLPEDLLAPVNELDKAGNINLKNIFSPDDVKQAIKDQAAAHNDFMGERRGVISHDDTREMASLVGMTPEKLATRVKGQAFNAEEMFAARGLLVRQATKVTELAKSAKGGSDLDKANFAEELTRLVAIQEQVSGATAEAGRTLSQFRMMAGATKEQVARLVEAQKAGGIDDILDHINALDDPTQVANFAAKAFKAKTSDMLMEAWINALLSGPQTHATNILSNTLVAAWGIPETAVASAVSKVTGSGIYAREALSRAFGFVEGAKDGVRAGARAFKTEEPTDFAGKIEVTKHQAIPGKVGKAIRVPGRLLMAEDEFFKSIGYRQEINALAMRAGLKEGLRGETLAAKVADLKANPTEEMMTKARDAAEKQTFTNPLGPFGKNIMALSREMPILRLIMPFVRTPVNIVKFAAERSPFAPLFKEVRANLKGANGAIARDTQIAKIALGSSVSAATVYAAFQGGITGGGPADPKQKAMLYASGWQPYSVKIGDNYYAYGRLEPLGMLLGVAADFAELSKHMNEDEKQSIASLIMGSVSKNLVSKTWLRGISEVIEAYQDPDRYGAKYIQNLAGTIVPTAVAQYARARDPYLREARTILDKIKERVPGYRESLPVRHDVFGEPIKLSGSLGPDLISPVYQSAAKNDPVVKEMLRLKIAPSQPARKIRGVDLLPEEYDALQVATGKTIRKGLETLFSQPQWGKIPDDVKTQAVEDLINKARDIGRATVMQKFPDLILRIRTNAK